MTQRTILVSCIHLQRCFDEFQDEFERRGYHAELPEVGQQLDEGWLQACIGRFDGVIAGDDPFSRRVLKVGAEGRLRALVKWGIGVDSIDRVAAREFGVGFAHTPGAFGDEVADVALGYVLMLARGLHQIDRSVREGTWLKPVGISLRGKTLGVIGLGSIGTAIGHRGSAFGMRVIGADVVVMDEWTRKWEQKTTDEVLAEADFLILACALTEANLHLLNEESLCRLKAGAFLINVARGPLIDEGALARSLMAGHLGGVALDVFEEEPLPIRSPLRGLPHCIFGSHNGSNTAEAVGRVNRLSVDLLWDLLQSAES